LSNALDDGFERLQRWHGREGARLAADSHGAAIDLIEAIQRDEVIDCEFKRVNGYLFLGPGDTEDRLTGELEAARQSGLTEARRLARAPLEFFDSGPCLEFPRQAQFHPLKYLQGLADAVRARGGAIYTHSDVIEVRGGQPAQVKTAHGFRCLCDAAVVATNVPFNNRIAIHGKNAPYRSYVIGLPVPAEDVRDLLLWDTADPYHYIRFVQESGHGQDIVLIGGEDHRTGHDTDSERHFQNLLHWARERLGLSGRAVARWSGQILEPIDGLAYIGRNPGDHDNVFVVTGDSGHGLTHGTLAGLILPDLILGRANPWTTLYDPARLHLRSLTRMMKDALESTVPYGDWLSEGDADSADQILKGEGAVIREGLHKLAVYKDEAGRLHACSAVCPHLGGIVRWNSAEKTWDCPCHGSRFDRYGQVINGPAAVELEPASDPRAPEAEGITPSV
jgi:glycine/D-amino acid oxidase-like deaminating enzyme/nitrite reductase/ring-hydroxylating ferredoxin subunit